MGLEEKPALAPNSGSLVVTLVCEEQLLRVKVDLLCGSPRREVVQVRGPLGVAAARTVERGVGTGMNLDQHLTWQQLDGTSKMADGDGGTKGRWRGGEVCVRRACGVRARARGGPQRG